MKNLYFITLILLILSCKDKSINSVKLSNNKLLNNNKRNLNVSIIKKVNFQKQIIANGKVVAQNKSELRFKTSERIASITVKNGQKIDQGKTIALLDNSLLENQLNRTKIEFDKADKILQEEKINFGLGDLPNESIEPKILKNLKIKSGYFEAQNAVEKAQLLYNQTILKSPFTGVVANINTKAGDYISSSDVFCTVIGQQQFEVVFSVLESELSFIKEKQDVTINLFVDESKTFKGLITEINPLVDENGLIQIKAKIIKKDNILFDGMNVKVIVNKSLEGVTVIPKEALVLRSNKEVVFTIENGLAKWNYVEILDENSNSYAIKKGLKFGDTIIVSGNMNLSHDTKVNPLFGSQQDDIN
ncbi:efflux RND transporter periplasmic adaptor subunit [Aestuariibaculum sp. M13]|uniref:efflux RND transporter periplasmic adaptor subunit n=1 Tax=Aestuariibaculum sp. M13 TaxID=2967132 RepID=UPI00215A0C57|nr:efflux RND transporter periplasmic adaptor subunit [Aestuariibaculum sp. M13]MCR8667463.1 efflux RND transporter periplasmic adaptor subunit [Aestuariibaculum sp. M13]